MVTQMEGNLMGHHGGYKNVELRYDPKCAGKMHAFPVEETQIANGEDLPPEDEPHERKGKNRIDTSKGMNGHVRKGLGGAIDESSKWDVQDGNITNHVGRSEANEQREPTNNLHGESINEEILKNYETYKKNKDKFIHLTLRKNVTHISNEHTPTGVGGEKKKNTSLKNVLNKDCSRRESKHFCPVYAEEEEAFEGDKNYAPFQNAQNGNALHNDRDIRESIMVHYTYGDGNHRGVTLQSNVHDRSNISGTSYDNTNAHFFQMSENGGDIRKGNILSKVGEQYDEGGSQKTNAEGERMTPVVMPHNPHTNEFNLHDVNNNMFSTSGTSYHPVGRGNSREKEKIPKCENINSPPNEGENGESNQGKGTAHSSYSLSMLMGGNRMDKIGCRLITSDAPNSGTTLYVPTHLTKPVMNTEKLCPTMLHEEHNRLCTTSAKSNERNESATWTGIPPIEAHSRSAANEIVNYIYQKGGHPWDNKKSADSFDPKNEAFNESLNEALGLSQTGGAVLKRDSCESTSQRKSVGDRGVLSRLLRKK